LRRNLTHQLAPVLAEVELEGWHHTSFHVNAANGKALRRRHIGASISKIPMVVCPYLHFEPVSWKLTGNDGLIGKRQTNKTRQKEQKDNRRKEKCRLLLPFSFHSYLLEGCEKLGREFTALDKVACPSMLALWSRKMSTAARSPPTKQQFHVPSSILLDYARVFFHPRKQPDVGRTIQEGDTRIGGVYSVLGGESKKK